MLPLEYRILKKRQDSDDVVTMELLPHGETKLPHCRPGQFNMLYAFGVGEVPISTSGPRDATVHTIRIVGATTKALSLLHTGDPVGVRGPFGSQWPLDDADGKDLVLGAGGLGMAPLRPIVLEVIQARARFGRVCVLYGTRSPSDFLYQDEWESWKAAGIDVHVTVGSATPQWKGHVGHVTTLVPHAFFSSPNTRAYLCGPEIMMRFTAYELVKRGVDKKDVYVSLERNMKCAIALCGHCQFREFFVCKDGPVFPFDRVEAMMRVREL